MSLHLVKARFTGGYYDTNVLGLTVYLFIFTSLEISLIFPSIPFFWTALISYMDSKSVGGTVSFVFLTRLIASEGHLITQFPHPIHLLRSILASLTDSSMLTAPI